MPSCSNNSTTASTLSKGKEIVGNDKPTKQKPKIKITNNSSPEDLLHASWEFLSVYQFFNAFGEFFRIPSNFSIEKLEQILLNNDDRSSRESSVSSNSSQTGSYSPSKFMILVITPLLSNNQKSKINVDNYEDHLLKAFPAHKTRFSEMKLMEKVKLLKEIEDWYMETGNESFTEFKNEVSAEDLRAKPLGTDSEKWTYWYFGDTRLYREIPIPNGKKGVDMIHSTDFTFELVCSSIEEWHNILQKFTVLPSLSKTELAKKIRDLGLKVIGILETREAARIRNENKLKRARELESIPKKRSRRLEAKFEEKAKLQEILDLEQQKEEYEEFERQKKRKEEKKALEQEKRDIKVEEARLRNEIHDYVQGLISNKFETDINLNELKNQMSVKASEEDHIVKMQGWVSLLSDDITLHVDKDNQISFEGDDLSEALEFTLLRNTLRTYILTLLKFKVDEEDEILQTALNEIYKNTLLKRFDHINTFCLVLNNVLSSSSTNIRNDAIDLLKKVFNHQ